MTVLATSKPTARAETVQKVTSPGGVQAWLVEDYAVPLVAFEMAFRGGATQDSEHRTGTAAALTSLLDEGAGELDAAAFQRALDDRAIEISFAADRDYLSGRVKTLSRHVEAAVDLLRLAVTKPRFDADAIDRVKGQISAGLRRDLKDPDALASRAWREAAYAGHPYGRPVRGTIDSVAAIERGDLLAAHRAQLARDGLRIAVVGAIDAVRLGRLLDEAFGPLPPHGSLSAVPDVTIAPGGAREIVDLDIPQTTIRFGLQGIARRDPDHMAAVVLNHILGGGVFSARLFKEVREKRGLAYSVYSQLGTFEHGALFSGGTSTKNERAAESMSVIEDEIAKLAAEGPSPEELAKAQRYLTGSYALRFDSSSKIANQLVNLQLEGFDVTYLDERNSMIDAVTMDEARRVGTRLFGGGKLLVTMVGRPLAA